MLVLATGSREFSEKWKRVLGPSEPIVYATSVEQLKSLLKQENVYLVILDLSMGECRKIEVLRSIASHKKKARFIFSGIQFKPAEELLSLTMGAMACCSKSFSVEECQKILNVVRQGGVWLSTAGIPELVQQLERFSKKGPSKKTLETATSSKELTKLLTKREFEVAQLVSEGANNKDIARKLDISDRTVKAHLTAIFDKLNVQDRLQLALRFSNQSK